SPFGSGAALCVGPRAAVHAQGAPWRVPRGRHPERTEGRRRLREHVRRRRRLGRRGARRPPPRRSAGRPRVVGAGRRARRRRGWVLRADLLRRAVLGGTAERGAGGRGRVAGRRERPPARRGCRLLVGKRRRPRAHAGGAARRGRARGQLRSWETTTVRSANTSSTQTASGMTTNTSMTTTKVPTTVTTTSATTTLCMTPDDGDGCYNEVIKTMRRIRKNPTSYDDLNAWSSFEEVQDYLYTTKNNKSKCGKSCACERLNTGSKCDQSVIYAMNEGVKQNPEDYSDLAGDATPEDFQSHLSKHVDAANCSMPCRAASWKGDPSLFCWSLAQQTGYEADVMRLQLSKGAGIFGCDSFAVASQDEWTIGQGPGGRVGEVRTIRFQGVEVGVSKDGTAGNAQLFMLAWNVILTRTTILKFDWAIKADPDAVVLVDRLRDHLRPGTGSKSFVRNCNEHPENPEYPMMYGSLEAISKGGLELYRENVDRCVAELAWEDWGEDVFLAKCLDFLGADPIDDFSLSSDGVCLGVDCHDTAAAAFHPFKSPDDWRQCWEAATAGLGGPLPPLP
ncbi:unnamed protein product, partial [Prorocentrum cordatum]